MNLSKLQGIVEGREACRATIHGVSKSWTELSDRTTTTLKIVGGELDWGGCPEKRKVMKANSCVSAFAANGRKLGP